MQMEKKVNFFLYQENFPILLWDNPGMDLTMRFNLELKPPGFWKHVCLK